jgi:geranylgeranyl diphosphate synthase type II
MAVAESFGKSPEDVADAGCAIEFVHCFSLIHDDLPAIDNDDLRRGLPTCHVKFGEAVAILAGDALFALAFEILANGSWSAEARIRAVASLTKATGSDGLVGGETLDILSEGKSISFETLQTIHRRKTGALIAASCEIGALLSGASLEESARMYEYGAAVGLAFQIADDLLNETSTAEALGKAAGSDRERGKATYPAMVGCEASQKAAEEAVRRGISCLEGFDNAQFLIEIAQYSIRRLY